MFRRRLGLAVGMVAVGLCAFGDSRPATSAAPFWLSPLASKHAGVIAVLGANQSSNWGGYNQGLLEKSALMTSVSGQWNVPTATQHTPGRSESSAAWIGIGGGCMETSCLLTDPTLIQAGTNSEVDADGTDHYSTWWEIIPLPQITTPLAVGRGQSVQVDISQVLPEIWSITIKNLSSGESFTTTVPYASIYGTAEWILETPLLIGTEGVGTSAMPDLDPVFFTNARVNGVSPNFVPAEQIFLCSNGHVLAAPSAPLTADSFSVSTYQGGC